MSNCTLAARQPIGNWSFVTAYPDEVITSPMGGNVGVATVKCIFKRQVMYWFLCCKRGFFPVSGTEWGTAEKGPESTQPVITLQMPLPIQGTLGKVADALGVSLEITTWFQDQEVANSTCSNPAITHVLDEVETPSCDRNAITLPWHTWSDEVALEELPEDAEKVK